MGNPRPGVRNHGCRALLAAAVVLASAMALTQQPAAAQLVDLELVLAVDASSSVSAEEFELQTRGLALAFRDPKVLRAIRAIGDLGVAVALFQWSENSKQVLAVDWTVVRDAESARAFSDMVADTPRFVAGGTALGNAMQYAIHQLKINGFEGRRKVIDVSGDGRPNRGVHPGNPRDAAVALGITINGLAILNEELTLDTYYRLYVAGGAGAFVMTANDYQAYAEAILAKLIREIGEPLVAARQAPADGA